MPLQNLGATRGGVDAGRWPYTAWVNPSSWDHPQVVAGPRVLLDTNTWSYLVSRDAVKELRAVTSAEGFTVIACPAVAEEILLSGTGANRRARYEAVAWSAWQRVLPESYRLAAELYGAIKELRPQWLDPHPELSDWRRLKAHWTTGLWWRERRRVAKLPDSRIRAIAAAEHQSQIQEAASRHAHWRAEAMTGRTLQFMMENEWAQPPEGTIGWDGDRLAVWRVENWASWRENLSDSHSPMYEWLAPWLTRRPIDAADWARFWFYDVDEQALTAHWLRWAFGLCQEVHSNKGGVVRDNQIATYLLDCDVLLTSDKIFIECADQVARLPPPRVIARCARILPENDLIAQIRAAAAQQESLEVLVDGE